jgi:hypothetical protein
MDQLDVILSRVKLRPLPVAGRNRDESVPQLVRWFDDRQVADSGGPEDPDPERLGHDPTADGPDCRAAARHASAPSRASRSVTSMGCRRDSTDMCSTPYGPVQPRSSIARLELDRLDAVVGKHGRHSREPDGLAGHDEILTRQAEAGVASPGNGFDPGSDVDWAGGEPAERDGVASGRTARGEQGRLDRHHSAVSTERM